MISSLLLWTGLAFAHRPHDLVVAFAAPPDLSTRGVAWLAMDPHDISTLMRSEDFGQHWDFMPSEVQDDELVAGAANDDEIVFLADDGTLWTTDDDGASWRDQDPTIAVGEGNALALSGSQAIIATRNGVLVGDVDDVAGMTHSLAGEGVKAVAFAADDPSEVLALTRDPELYMSTDGGASFSLVKSGIAGGRSPLAVAAFGGIVYVGTDHGVVWLDPDDATWDTCGTLPVTVGGEYSNDVPVLEAMPDGRLMATSGEQAIFWSEDGCTTWTLQDSGVEVAYGEIGDAQSSDEAFAGLYADGDLELVAGFMGLTQTQDGGDTWTDAQLLPEDYCKGVAIAPDYPADPRVFRSGYGGGVAWTADGGQTWEGSAVGVSSAYSNDVTPAWDVADSDIVYYSGSNDPYRSEDGGLTWTSMSVPMDRVRRYRDFGDRVWVLGEDSNNGVKGRLAWSDDRGDTWNLVTGAATATGNAAPRDLNEGYVDGEAALLLLTDEPTGLYASTDQGDTWEQLYDGEQEAATLGLSWPPDSGTRLVAGSPSSGVLLSDDGGANWRSPTTPIEGRIHDYAYADDGTLFVTNRAGQFWRSDDGGDNWQAVGDSVGRAIFVVSASADFAATQTLILGTQDGVYWSNDAAQHWHVFPRYQRLEANTHLLLCAKAGSVLPTEGCDAYQDDAFSSGGGWALDAGDRITATYKGDAFRIVGTGDASFDVSEGTEDLGTATPGEIFTLEASGWHDLILTPDAEFDLDLVEVFAPGDVMPIATASEGEGEGEGEGETGTPDSGVVKDQGGCGGCASGGAEDAPGLLGLALALAATRRRRAPSAPAAR